MTDFTHVDDYPEIPVSLRSTRAVLKTGTWRSVRPVLTARRAPCSAACPAGVAVPAFVDAAAAGRLEEAFEAITGRNPFPRLTGRVCPHTCEHRCNLSARTGDEPLSIRALERWLGDATAHLRHEPGPATSKRVAVVGAGPAGLAAAFYLRRTGHEVTVFDRRARPGGMLRYGIPDYRLPAAIVDDEVARLAAMGIEFRTNTALGVDIALGDLEATYAAVFVATGAWGPRPAGIRGESLLEPGLAFLEAAKHGEVSAPGRRCAVIGGGNTAIDVARVLRRLEAEVTVLYRRTAAEMPAIAEGYERAAAEGVRFEWRSQPRAVEKGPAGLTLTVEAMDLGAPDASGRRRPEPTGRVRELHFDAAFAAIGEAGDLHPFPASLWGDAGRLAVGDDGATADPLLFAGGDLATGPSTVIEAIVAGRRAARAIDHQLGFGSRWPEDDAAAVVGPTEVNPASVPRRDRPADRPGGGTDPFAEEALTLSDAEALEEIERCLSCGHCNACGVCFVFCPDGAITWQEGPVIDHGFCKGCGICVTECPGHAFVLVGEREAAYG